MTTLLENVYDSPVQKRFFDSILKQNKLGNIQVFFKSTVLDKYRESSGYKIIRTDSSGRISRKGSWALDFGISGGDELLHLPIERLTSQIPEAELEHFLEFLVTLPLSENFVKGLVRRGCIDDGRIREW